MRRIFTIVLFLSSFSYAIGQIWMASNSKIRFFSTTPIEDIEAINDYAAGALNVKTGRVYFKAMMRAFKFEKKLMQEHFNENYIESDKYPIAEYDGMIQNPPDLSKDGSYQILIKGFLTLHGVKVSRDVKASLKVHNGKMEGKALFLVPCHDHNIKIPSISRKNISDNIEVTIFANFIPKV